MTTSPVAMTIALATTRLTSSKAFPLDEQNYLTRKDLRQPASAIAAT